MGELCLSGPGMRAEAAVVWELILQESLHCSGTFDLQENLPGSSGLPVLKWLLRMGV